MSQAHLLAFKADLDAIKSGSRFYHPTVNYGDRFGRDSSVANLVKHLTANQNSPAMALTDAMRFLAMNVLCYFKEAEQTTAVDALCGVTARRIPIFNGEGSVTTTSLAYDQTAISAKLSSLRDLGRYEDTANRHVKDRRPPGRLRRRHQPAAAARGRRAIKPAMSTDRTILPS